MPGGRGGLRVGGGPGAVTSYQYDALNRLGQMTSTVSGNTFNQYTHTYNDQDQRAAEDFIEPLPRADKPTSG